MLDAMSLTIWVHTVSAERSKNGLPALTNYVIDVISATRDLANESSQSGQELPVPELLVEGIDDIERLKEQKLGSTYIRQWLSQRMTSQTTSKNS
jgi:phosphopantetheine adenylyltransferase